MKIQIYELKNDVFELCNICNDKDSSYLIMLVSYIDGNRIKHPLTCCVKCSIDNPIVSYVKSFLLNN